MSEKSERLVKLQERILGTGAEPTFTPLKSGRLDLINGLNFYNVHKDFSDSKKYAVAWVKKNRPDLYKRLSGVKDIEFSNRGFICRMVDRGYNLGEVELANLNKFFDELASGSKQEQFQAQDETAEKPVAPIIKKTQHNKTLESIEYATDNIMSDSKTIEPVVFAGCSKAQLTEIIDHCQTILTAMAENIDGCYLQTTVRKLKPAFTRWIKEATARIEATKPAKAPKTAKTSKAKVAAKKPAKAPVAKEVKLNVPFCPESIEYGLTSMDPKYLIGRTTAIMFNVRYKYLIIFTAADESGFSFKGNTLQNVQNSIGQAKRVRNPEIFKSMTKTTRILTDLFTSLPSKVQENATRLNANTIIVSVA